ncbi:MAG: Tfp pilus assembly protein PilE/TM2 domain-containing membrane protein YozV [Flavobacteriales bacterium]|jgi:Tfp pilus assembly protein PilE/TM2 domain-containing membrane protein YozV
MDTYTIYFTNTITDKYSIEEVREKLTTTFKLTEKQLDIIFSKEKTILKRNLNKGALTPYENALNQCGLNFYVEQSAEQEPEVNVTLELVKKAETHDTKIDRSKTDADHNEADNIYEAPISNNEETVFCRSCGGKIGLRDIRCSNCQTIATVAGPGRSKIAAGFLAFFLGGLGIHRFYLRQWWGIFYILLWPFGISSIISLIEAIVFWSTSKESWNKKHGHLPASNMAIVVLAAILPVIAIIGILAAFAIPAYQDYTDRAKISEGINQLDSATIQVTHFIQENQLYPSSKADAGLQDLSATGETLKSIDIIEGGKIVGTFFKITPNGNEYTLVYTPILANGSVSWECKEGTLPNRLRLKKCRDSNTGTTITTPETLSYNSLTSNTGTLRISVPSSWKSGILNNEDATLDAGDIFREAYVLVIEEHDFSDGELNDIYELGEQYSQYYIENSLKGGVIIGSDAVTAGDLKGISYDIRAEVEEVQIHYIIGFYAAGNSIYQVFTWTLPSHYDRNEADLRAVIESFELLP